MGILGMHLGCYEGFRGLGLLGFGFRTRAVFVSPSRSANVVHKDLIDFGKLACLFWLPSCLLCSLLEVIDLRISDAEMHARSFLFPPEIALTT